MDDIVEEYERPWWIKVLIGILALLLILMLVTWTFSGFPVFSFFERALIADQIQGNVLEGPPRIEMHPLVVSTLRNTYQNESIEFAACLNGTIDNGTYKITQLTFPEVVDRSFGHVRSASCDGLIMLHSHPSGQCAASETDLTTLAQVQQTNPERVMVIMCAEDKYLVVSP